MVNKLYTNEFLDQYRLIADSEADSVVHELFTSFGHQKAWQTIHQKDWNAILNLTTFISKHSHFPPFADQKKVRKALIFFEKYQSSIMISLYGYALPYCYLAGEDAKVLLMTQRLKTDAQKRLFETAGFLVAIFNKSNHNSATFFEEILKIRLTHAAVRYSLKFSNKALDFVPINQEAMAGTNLAFSLIILRGLRKLGFVLSTDESNSFFHFWAIVGFVLGVDAKILPVTLSEAINLDRMISNRHFGTSEAGVQLCQALVDAGNNQPAFEDSFIKPKALFTFFLGSNYAKMLGIANDVKLVENVVFSNFNLLGNLFPIDKNSKVLDQYK